MLLYQGFIYLGGCGRSFLPKLTNFLPKLTNFHPKSHSEYYDYTKFIRSQVLSQMHVKFYPKNKF